MNRFRLVIPSILLFASCCCACRPSAPRSRHRHNWSSGPNPPIRIHLSGTRSRQCRFPWSHPSLDSLAAGRRLPGSSQLAYRQPGLVFQGREAEYGNKFVEFKPTAEQSAAGFDVTLRFTAVRREHKVALDAATLQNVSASTPGDPNLQRYHRARQSRSPSTAPLPVLAKEHTAGDTTPLQKARHIYDYVLATMRYDKLAKAGAAATPSGRALPSAAIAPISIPCL